MAEIAVFLLTVCIAMTSLIFNYTCVNVTDCSNDCVGFIHGVIFTVGNTDSRLRLLLI